MARYTNNGHPAAEPAAEVEGLTRVLEDLHARAHHLRGYVAFLEEDSAGAMALPPWDALNAIELQVTRLFELSELALTELHRADPLAEHPPSAGVHGAVLSARQLQVAELIAAGLSNRIIAEQLGLAQATVTTHVKHLLAKLQLTSRSQIAAWWAVSHR